MRTMINEKGQKLKVTEHIILRNFWEYYVIDAETNEGEVKLCYVLGNENELGDVYLPEIKPYILSKTNRLDDLMPAPGFSWEAAP